MPLGFFEDGTDAFGMEMLMDSDIKVAGFQNRAAVAAAMTVLHVRQRLVALYVYRVHKVESDCDEVKRAAVAWIEAVRAANRAPALAPATTP